MSTKLKIDDQFILEHYGYMTQREIADHFGVSVSTVNRHVKALGLTPGLNTPSKESAETRTPTKRIAPSVAQSDKERLEELLSLVYDEILKCEGPSIAKLSKEYREILADIRALEGDVADGKPIGFLDLTEQYADRVPGANS